MKTAQTAKAEARTKELELAGQAGVTPEDIKDGETVQLVVPNPTDIQPTASAPATPTGAPDKPVETPPAQDEPSAAVAAPQTPADGDYKSLFEQERSARIKAETSGEELRSKFNRELTARQQAELHNRILQTGVGHGQPAEQPPAGNGDTVPAQEGRPMEDIEAEIAKVVGELNEDAGEEMSSRFARLSALHAEKAVASSLSVELGKIRDRFDPVLENVKNDIRLNTAATQEIQHTEARKVIGEGHPNWEAIVNSEPFQTWVANHPLAYQYQMGLNPGDSGMGMTPGGVVKVLDEYIAQDPVLQAEKARLVEAQQREAAAAHDEGAVIPTTPVIDTYGEGEKVTRSEFIRLAQEHKNNIPELKKLNQRMDQAIATGNFVDDLSRG